MKRPYKSRIGRIQLLILVLSIAVLTGCTGAGRSKVLKPAEAETRFSSLTISEADSSIDIPPHLKTYFHERLSKLLYKKYKFLEGEDLRLTYSFTRYEPGNRFVRFLIGGILAPSAAGVLYVDVKFIDREGTELSTIQVKGTVAGFASTLVAARYAASETAYYTDQNFGKNHCPIPSFLCN